MHKYPVRNPDQQGHIDGLCGLYSVLNACNLLLGLDERQDAHLFSALCKGAPGLFPDIVCDGVGLRGVQDLLRVAGAWIADVPGGRRLRFTLEMAGPPLGGLDAVFTGWREGLATHRSADSDAVWIVGLGPPWNHWTVIEHVGAAELRFRDSWGIKERRFADFTLDPAESGAAPGRKIMLDYHQSLLVLLSPRVRPLA